MTRKTAVELSTTEEVVAWMEREYLSELTLGDLEPSPGPRPPQSIRFTWWLHAGGARTPYRLEARGVDRWSLEGELDEQAISIAPLSGGTTPIALEMVAGGRLTLACRTLRVARGRPVREARAARPFTDYAYFTLDGVGEPSPGALARGLSDAPGVTLRARGEPVTGALVEGGMDVALGSRVVAAVFFARRRDGGWLSIARKDASDDEWHRCQALPHHLAAARVRSAWEFDGDSAQWLALVSPPRGPA